MACTTRRHAARQTLLEVLPAKAECRHIVANRSPCASASLLCRPRNRRPDPFFVSYVYEITIRRPGKAAWQRKHQQREACHIPRHNLLSPQHTTAHVQLGFFLRLYYLLDFFFFFFLFGNTPPAWIRRPDSLGWHMARFMAHCGNTCRGGVAWRRAVFWEHVLIPAARGGVMMSRPPPENLDGCCTFINII